MPTSILMSPEACSVVAASKLFGESLVNQRHGRSGHIHELILDVTDGRLAYAVVSFGTTERAAARFLAVPWTAIEYSTTDRRLVHRVGETTLEAAPSFDRDARWPDFSDRVWGADIYKYYGCEPYWAQRPA